MSLAKHRPGRQREGKQNSHRSIHATMIVLNVSLSNRRYRPAAFDPSRDCATGAYAPKIMFQFQWQARKAWTVPEACGPGCGLSQVQADAQGAVGNRKQFRCEFAQLLDESGLVNRQ